MTYRDTSYIIIVTIIKCSIQLKNILTSDTPKPLGYEASALGTCLGGLGYRLGDRAPTASQVVSLVFSYANDRSFLTETVGEIYILLILFEIIGLFTARTGCESVRNT